MYQKFIEHSYYVGQFIEDKKNTRMKTFCGGQGFRKKFTITEKGQSCVEPIGRKE